MKSNMRGVAEMLSKLKTIAEKNPERIGAALYKRAQPILTAAKRRCPVEPGGGALRASGQVSRPERIGDRTIVTISFGGPAMGYAVAVHEHLSEHSPPSWVKAEQSGKGIHWNAGGTGPKFLEGPMNEAEASIVQDLGRDLHVDKVIE